MTPEQLAKSGSEHSEQRALFAWVRMAQKHGMAAANDPRCYEKGGMEYATATYGTHNAISILRKYYAVPNGGKRDKITAAKLKAEGVRPGVPDTHFPVACGNYHSLYIEMKKVGGKLSEDQEIVIADLIQEGNSVEVCEGWIAAVEKLMAYLYLGNYHIMQNGIRYYEEKVLTVPSTE